MVQYEGSHSLLLQFVPANIQVTNSVSIIINLKELYNDGSVTKAGQVQLAFHG
jgi:hypothetical protein